MSFKNVAVLLTVLGFSCGDVVESIGEQKTETSPGTFSGTVAGHELTVKSAVFRKGEVMNQPTVFLYLTDVPDFCALLKANRWPKNATLFASALFRVKPDGVFLTPDVGSYTVLPGQPPTGLNSVRSDFVRNDAGCAGTLAPNESGAQSGLIDVTELNPVVGGKMSGTFDVTFGDQKDKATGTFSAEYCDAFYVDSSQPSCE